MQQVCVDSNLVFEFEDKSRMPDSIVRFREVREDDVEVGAQVKRRMRIVDEEVQEVVGASVDLEAALEIVEPVPVVRECLESQGEDTFI